MRKRFENKKLRDIKYRVLHEYGGTSSLEYDQKSNTYSLLMYFPKLGDVYSAMWYCIRSHTILDAVNQALQIIDDYDRSVASVVHGTIPSQWIRMTPPDYHRTRRKKPRVAVYRGTTYGILVINIKLNKEVNWDAA